VYADSEGTKVIKNFSIVDESAEHPPAGQNGVMKATVSRLTPGTTYYFQIVTISDWGTLVEPASIELPSVRTEVSSVVVNNDLIAHRILQSDGSTPAAGALLVALVEGGSYPVTGWVGAGVQSPWALVDLNNIYSETEHSNFDLSGGEAITLESIGGSIGFRRLNGVVPVKNGGVQTLIPEPSDAECTLYKMVRPIGLRIERR
jgi:hypothetical protein